MKTNNLLAIVTVMTVLCFSSMLKAANIKTMPSDIESIKMHEYSEMESSENIIVTNFEEHTMSGDQIKKLVLSEMKYPEMKSGEKLDGDVYVEYHLELDGMLIVDQMNGSKKELCNYVKSKLESMLLLSDENPDKKFYVHYKFKTM